MRIFSELILAVEIVTLLIIALGALRAAWVTLRYRHPHEARRVLAQSVLSALGFLVVATVLKTIELRDWRGIGMFAAVFGIRTLVKWDFASVLKPQPRG
jgi:uncharacterized membrane protein